jgi:hypothetical protein
VLCGVPATVGVGVRTGERISFVDGTQSGNAFFAGNFRALNFATASCRS